jgi:hypothetical protein
VAKAGDQYLEKLAKAGATQAQLDEARRLINEKITSAAQRVADAQKAAAQDDIVRRTTRITEEHEYFRKLGRTHDDHERIRRLGRLHEERENVNRRNRLQERQVREEREYTNKRR